MRLTILRTHFFYRCGLALTIAALGRPALGQLAAFPGAVGFGADTTGGRGGSVYVVTNLNNSGAGSFRDAVSQSNRIIVFAVSGYEDITSPISTSSNLTILGQTAPGGGFGVYGAEISFYGKSNDMVQYMRFRDTSQDPGGTSTSNSSGNCVNLGNTSNMIFDHDSLEFASYNNIDASGTTGANNLTFQNSIIADPILSQQFNFHWQGNQGTFINNIFANAHNRSILAKGNTQFVNNTVYNYQAGFTTGDSSGGFNFDIVNNYFRSGPSTTSAGNAFYQVDSNQTAYAVGNLLNGSSDNSTGATVSSTPLLPTTTSLPTLSATAANAFNLVHSGDSLTHDPATFASSLGYDQVDQQVISNVASNGAQGRLYNTEKDTGLSNNGLGTITSGTAPTSTANDGIPDSWKLTHGLSTTAADSTLLNPLGYTMIEEYATQIADLYNSQTWSAASGNWVTNSSNWSSTVPGDYDHALIRGNGVTNGSATISGSNAATAFSLSIGGNGPAAGESLLVSGGSLLAYNGITVGDQNNGSLQITGGTVTAATVQLGNTVWNSSGTTSTTYTGALVLGGGTLQTGEMMQGGGTPGHWTTGSAWTWSGGTLQASPAGLLVSAPATLGAGGGTLDTNGVSAQLNGALTGSGSFTVIGGGTATLSNASSGFTGNIVVNGGTLINTGAVNSANPTTGGLGNGQTGGRNITVNSGGILSLNIGNSFGNTTSTPQVTTIINQGGVVETAVPSGSGGGGGDANTLGNLILNGGTLTAGNGYSTKFQAIVLGGSVTVGGTTASTINTDASNTTANGVMLGSNTIFNVANVTGNANPSLTVSDNLTWGQGAGSTTVNSGGFTKSGAGAMLLTGTNGYTGTTTVSAGTLTIGGAGQLGAGSYAGNVSNSGTFVFNSTAVQTLSGVISGAGAVTDSGSGTLTLSGSESFTGNLTASSGSTLVLTGNNTARGASVTQLNGNGTLQLQANAGNIVNGDCSVLTGSATGFTVGNAYPTAQSVAIQLRSDSSVTFTGANALGGVGNTAMNFDVGNINAGNSNNTLAFAPGGFNVYGTMINITGNSGYSLALGTLTNSGAGGSLTLNPTTGNLIVAGIGQTSGNTTLLAQGSGNTTISGAINIGSGGAVVKSGSGVLTLGGSSAYAGGTTISAGTLLANNATGSGTGTGTVNVNGGFLRGTGTISGEVNIGAGGTISPGIGNAANILTSGAVTSNGTGATTATAGNFSFAINSTTGLNDELISTGAVTLGNNLSLLSVTDLGNTKLTNKTFVLINAAAGISGTFAGLADNMPFTVGTNTYIISYDQNGGDQVTLSAPEPGMHGVLGLMPVLLSRRRRRKS